MTGAQIIAEKIRMRLMAQVERAIDADRPRVGATFTVQELQIIIRALGEL